MTELDPQTFNIADMFTGAAFPKESVTIYTNEEAGYQLDKLNKRISREIGVKDNDEVLTRLEKEAKELLEKVNQSRYIFHMTGVSRESVAMIVEKARQAYPSKYGTFGQELPNPEQDEHFNNLLWAIHTERIEAPNGAVITAPDDTQMKIIRANLGTSQQAKIKSQIDEFSSGSASGFEAAAQESDFLSQP